MRWKSCSSSPSTLTHLQKQALQSKPFHHAYTPPAVTLTAKACARRALNLVLWVEACAGVLRAEGSCRGSRLPAAAGPAMGSRPRPAALCGAALAMAGGAALAAWAWARLRGRGAPPAAQQGPGAGRGEPPALRLCPFPSIGVAPQGKRQGRQILVLGLDGAGKSSLLQALATNQVKRSLAPTEGFNAVCIATEESQMEFLESEWGLFYYLRAPVLRACVLKPRIASYLLVPAPLTQSRGCFPRGDPAFPPCSVLTPDKGKRRRGE